MDSRRFRTEHGRAESVLRHSRTVGVVDWSAIWSHPNICWNQKTNTQNSGIKVSVHEISKPLLYLLVEYKVLPT